MILLAASSLGLKPVDITHYLFEMKNEYNNQKSFYNLHSNVCTIEWLF